MKFKIPFTDTQVDVPWPKSEPEPEWITHTLGGAWHALNAPVGIMEPRHVEMIAKGILRSYESMAWGSLPHWIFLNPILDEKNQTAYVSNNMKIKHGNLDIALQLRVEVFLHSALRRQYDSGGSLEDWMHGSMLEGTWFTPLHTYVVKDGYEVMCRMNDRCSWGWKIEQQ